MEALNETSYCIDIGHLVYVLCIGGKLLALVHTVSIVIGCLDRICRCVALEVHDRGLYCCLKMGVYP